MNKSDMTVLAVIILLVLAYLAMTAAMHPA